MWIYTWILIPKGDQQNSTLIQAESIRSGAKIRVQPASVQRRKTSQEKENVDPTAMGAPKKKT